MWTKKKQIPGWWHHRFPFQCKTIWYQISCWKMSCGFDIPLQWHTLLVIMAWDGEFVNKLVWRLKNLGAPKVVCMHYLLQYVAVLPELYHNKMCLSFWKNMFGTIPVLLCESSVLHRFWSWWCYYWFGQRFRLPAGRTHGALSKPYTFCSSGSFSVLFISNWFRQVSTLNNEFSLDLRFNDFNGRTTRRFVSWRLLLAKQR